MKLKALFDIGPWERGQVFEATPDEAAALMAKDYGHYEIVLDELPPEPPEPVAEPEPPPEPEPVVASFDAPPADKMLRKPKGRK